MRRNRRKDREIIQEYMKQEWGELVGEKTTYNSPFTVNNKTIMS